MAGTLRSAPLVAALALAGLTVWPASASMRAADPEPATDLVRLIAPVPGSTLVAGSMVAFEWEPGPDLAAFPHAEEWEVFLSVDGGRTYLSRLTPHLEIDMRRLTVRVPELPSDDVRLLLRMGDERDEREQSLPGRYRIVADNHLPSTWRWRQLGRAEAARPGAPGVMEWVEGGRDGRGWKEWESAPDGSEWSPSARPGSSARPAVGAARRIAPKVVRTASLAVAASAASRPAQQRAVDSPHDPPRLSRLCRRNE